MLKRSENIHKTSSQLVMGQAYHSRRLAKPVNWLRQAAYGVEQASKRAIG